MKIDILTLFPDMFDSIINESIIGRAHEKKIFSVNCINIRDFSTNKHKKVDDYPFGGGPGMIMKPEPVFKAIDSVSDESARIIYLTPRGRVYNQQIAKELAKEEHLVLLCGHYEGIDDRIIENYVTDEISIGDYVLTGGELSAMIIIDSVVRMLPGVLSKDECFTDESHFNGLLEHSQYTRPREFNGFKVPDVLLSGNHEKIAQWREYESLKSTYIRRPDLLNDRDLTEKEKKMLDEIKLETEN